MRRCEAATRNIGETLALPKLRLQRTIAISPLEQTAAQMRNPFARTKGARISDRWLGLKRNADWRAEAVVLFRL